MSENKYHARSFVDGNGIRWDSQKEYRRYFELKALQKVGVIDDLERQKRFEILPRITKTVTEVYHTAVKKQKRERVKEVVVEKPKFYTCDFYYHDCERDVWVIEDCKSHATKMARDYPLRRHLMMLKCKAGTEWSLEHSIANPGCRPRTYEFKET